MQETRQGVGHQAVGALRAADSHQTLRLRLLQPRGHIVDGLVSLGQDSGAGVAIDVLADFGGDREAPGRALQQPARRAAPSSAATRRLMRDFGTRKLRAAAEKPPLATTAA